MKAIVINVSNNTNSFGYKGVILMSTNGETMQVMVQAYGTDIIPIVGDDVDPDEQRFINRCIMPSVSPLVAKKLIKEIKDETSKTKT